MTNQFNKVKAQMDKIMKYLKEANEENVKIAKLAEEISNKNNQVV